MAVGIVTQTTDTPGITLATGPDDGAQEWVGETGATHFAQEPINAAMSRLYASMVEDGYPPYWDRAVAEQHWDSMPAPPGTLTVWRRPLLWRPDDRATEERELFAQVPFPSEKEAILTVAVDSTFDRRLYAGEWLNWQDEIVEISPEKETDLGSGHFITSETTYRNQRGERVATNTKTLFRYEPERADGDADAEGSVAAGRRNVAVEDSSDRVGSLAEASVAVGDSVPAYQFPVTYEKVIYDVAATRDFYPGHHDPEFARTQGNETIFLNNIAFQGLADRLALEWAGPEWRVRNRRIQIQGAAPAGSRLTVEGEVVDVQTSGRPIELTIEGRILTDDGENICPCSITIVKGPA